MSEILELVISSEKNRLIGLAGPGTGKSFTFKTIIESNHFQGKKILVLSFINKLVDDLKNDFSDYNNVDVLTLHAYAMQEYAKLVKKDIELDESLDDIVTQDRYLLTDQTFSYQAKFHMLELSEDDQRFYDERSAFYANKDILHSFNSIINAISSLYSENNELIPEYDLILVDEFQDFNQLEWGFIKLLNLKSKVMLVGDDDQSLYGWKNAQPQLIRSLYKSEDASGFSLDYCFRCTRVIVDAVNQLIYNSARDGLLADRVNDKKYLYPENRQDKDEISSKYSKIDFIPNINGAQLFYQLAARIKRDVGTNVNKRVLILVPSYFKQQAYEGLVKQGLNVVEFELFGDEKHRTLKHRYIIESFRKLEVRKTDNLAIRRIMYLYIDDQVQKQILTKSTEGGKKLWNCLDGTVKEKIENDIALFKKVRKGKDPLETDELLRLNEIFNLKNILSKVINRFDPHTKSGIEIELTTVMSSKGLSADFVYYLGVDDYIVFNNETKSLTDQGICEFLVGITRAKEKLTITSFRDANPKLISYISSQVNKVSVR